MSVVSKNVGNRVILVYDELGQVMSTKGLLEGEDSGFVTMVTDTGRRIYVNQATILKIKEVGEYGRYGRQ